MDDIIVFGHSVTLGFWDPEGGWVQRLRTFLDQRALETQDEDNVFYVYNLGVAGDTVEDLLQRMEEEFDRRTEKDYDTLILLQVGANDALYLEEEGYLTPEEEFRDGFEELLELASELADGLGVVGDFPHDPSLEKVPYAPDHRLDHEKFGEYEAIKKELCREREVPYIDLVEITEGTENSRYLEEGVHPNAEGHSQIAGKVKEKLEEGDLL
ncbi:MAG: GDSL-type esterase/lipase family protein [Candidatus Nanohaloarchaea archaeon]